MPLRVRRAEWQIIRYVRIPEHAWMPAPAAEEPAGLTFDGAVVPDEVDGLVRPGDVRVAFAPMDPRSTAWRDAGKNGKRRPALVTWVDDELGQVGIHFLYDTGSAVRREGNGRLLRGWKAAGLDKRSVVSVEEELRGIADLGGLIGRVPAAEIRRLDLVSRPARSW